MKLHFRRVAQRALQRTLRRGNHGREIRCMALRPSQTGEVILASGSEDTYINFTEGMFPSFYADESSKCGVIMCTSEETVQHGSSNVNIFCRWEYHVFFCWCERSVNLAVAS